MLLCGIEWKKLAGFLGTYDSTVDTKGRFHVPTGLRKQMPEGTQTLVVNRGMDKCLWMYLISDWQVVEERLRQVNAYDSRENRLIRKALIADAVYIELDSAGRLNIPKKLADYAGLDKEIVLAGDIDKVEIWDKESYESLFESLTPEKLSQMAAQILGTGQQNNTQ